MDVITSQTGTVVADMSFSAVGHRREPGTWEAPVGTAEIQTDHDADRYGFTHQEMLDNVNLIHMNGRVYDPNLGRFLSVDPIFEFPTNTQSLNPYSYVLNNPLSMTDPTGYATACPNGSSTACPNELKAGDTAEKTFTPTGSHIAIHDYATVQKNGDVAAGSTDPGAAQAMVHAASQLFGGNGQQNRNNGPGSGVDLGKTAQNGPMAQNTGGIAANTNAATGSQTQMPQTDNLPRLSHQSEIEAEVYAEQTHATVSAYRAMISVIVNRANSKDHQYVDHGKVVNIRNVLNHKGAFQARNTRSYIDFLDSSGRVPENAINKVISGIVSFIRNGPNTNATFFIVTPNAKVPTENEVNALGNVISAKPPQIDGVYLYNVRPPGS